MKTMDFTFTETARNTFNYKLDQFKDLRRGVLRLNSNSILPVFMDRLVDLCDDFKTMEVGETIYFALCDYEVYYNKTLKGLNESCKRCAEIGEKYVADRHSAMKVKRTNKLWKLELLEYSL